MDHFHKSNKTRKYLTKTQTRSMPDIWKEDYKMLLKNTERDLKNGETYMFLGGKSQYCNNINSSQANL